MKKKKIAIGICIAAFLLCLSWTVFAGPEDDMLTDTIPSEQEGELLTSNSEGKEADAVVSNDVMSGGLEETAEDEQTSEEPTTEEQTTEETNQEETYQGATEPEKTKEKTFKRGTLRTAPEPISATVTWGDMEFVFDEADQKWSCEVDSNKVDVLNNSDSAAVTVTYSYDAKDGFNEYGMSIFDTEIQEYAMGSVGVVCTSLVDDGTFTSGAIAVGDTDTRWFMFTEAAGSELGTESFPIGTLNIVVSRLE